MADVVANNGEAPANANAANNGGGGGGMLWRMAKTLVMFSAINSLVGLVTKGVVPDAASSSSNGGNAGGGSDDGSSSHSSIGGASSASSSSSTSAADAPDGLLAMFGMGPVVNNFPKKTTHIAPFMANGDLLYFLVEMVEKRGEGEFAVVGADGVSAGGSGGEVLSTIANAGSDSSSAVVSEYAYPILSSGESLPTPPPADHDELLNRLIRPYFSSAVYEDAALTAKLLERRRAEEEAAAATAALPLRIEGSTDDSNEAQRGGSSSVDKNSKAVAVAVAADEDEANFFPFSLSEPIRNITKMLNLTSCVQRNCTLIAKVSVFYQHPDAAHPEASAAAAAAGNSNNKNNKNNKNKRRSHYRRLLTMDIPLITFVERVETEMVSLLGGSDEDDDDENTPLVGADAAAALGLPAPSRGEEGESTTLVVLGEDGQPKKTAKKTTKKKKTGAVRSRTRRQRTKIDSAIDGALDWAKAALLGRRAGGEEDAAKKAGGKPTASDATKKKPIANSNASHDDDDDDSGAVVLMRSSSAVAAANSDSNDGSDDADGAPRVRYQALFQPTLTLSPVVDFSVFPIANLPAPVSRFFAPVAHPPPTPAERARCLVGGYESPLHTPFAREQMRHQATNDRRLAGTALYAPIIHVNKFWVLEEHLIPLNATNCGAVPLTLSIEPLSLVRFLMYTQFDDSMARNEEWGTMSRYDSDMTKKIFLESNILLLIVTMVVSSLHSIFEFLAIKNDVSFWRNRKSFKGLSLRTIAVNLYFQAVIFLYLLDSEETSYMVLIPAGISVFVEGWKLLKTLKFDRDPATGRRRLNFSASYDEQTRTYDQQAMRYLTYLLVPCLVGYSIYSAMYHDHKGWYSFLIGCQVKFIYFSGFIMMTPQIFINYKLKSVTAVPWRTFVYRFLNTIVDDLFAFVITMPTLHRIACFRDDVVFLILLFQRWQYPVDVNRTEDGYHEPPVTDVAATSASAAETEVESSAEEKADSIADAGSNEGGSDEAVAASAGDATGGQSATLTQRKAHQQLKE